ncbi:MAG: serpin family protein [Lachnospiraceae bacterium]|nr:serpin family protein [Lachnospiraceae bacterium]
MKEKRYEKGKIRRNRTFYRVIALVLAVSLLYGCGASPEGDTQGMRSDSDPWGGGGRNQTVYQKMSLTPAPVFSEEDTAEAVELLSRDEAAAFGDFSVYFMREAVKKARQEGRENPVLSPVSAGLALMLAACGSAGDTRTEFEEVLGLSSDQWGTVGGQLMRYMNQTAGTLKLQTANSVWVKENAQIKQEYLRQVGEELYSEVFHGDLSAEDTRQAVNTWVRDRTQDMIPELLKEPFKESVTAVLLNAVYMEGKWQQPFAAEDTISGLFHTEDGEEITVSYLCDIGCERAYVQGEGVEGILLPYEGGNLVFLALRSTDGRKAEELLTDLSLDGIRNLMDGAAETRMNFSMPRFTLEYRQDLEEALMEMGLLQSFDPENADFTSMGTGSEGESLYMKKVRQDVKLQVDEEGTKAAAVTRIEMEAGGAMAPAEPVLELHFDQPYFYAIVDRDTGLPVFMGLMERPPETNH